MKAQYSLIILFIFLISCKQEYKKDFVTEEVKKSVTIEQPKKEAKISQETVQKEKEQTIEQFLQQLQTAVKNNDVATIEKSLKFPIEFNWGGESSFYKNYQEVKENNDMFSYILEARFIEKDDDIYKVRYLDPESKDYFVTFYFVKIADGFKLTTFMQPH